MSLPIGIEPGCNEPGSPFYDASEESQEEIDLRLDELMQERKATEQARIEAETRHVTEPDQ